MLKLCSKINLNRRKNTICFILIIGVLALASFIFNDDIALQNIASSLSKWSSGYPIEKVYLQLDKPYYASGDDIWFKAYVTLGAEHKLSKLSGIVNVELINDNGLIKQRIKLPVINGLAWGDFALPDTLQDGNYRIRAYTNYMRNAGEDYFFDQHIAVVNAISNRVFTKTAFTYKKEDGSEKIQALISYADIKGDPYIGKEVKYKVLLNSKDILSGKGITDGAGNIAIEFVNEQPLINNGYITTNVTIENKELVTKVIPIKATFDNIDVQFFPESGNLINGINSKVAFKAIGVDGLGSAIKGTVVDDQNNIITNFNSEHLGMGCFNLTPLAGINYKAHVVFADGSEKTIDLPKAEEGGYVLSVETGDQNDIKLKIAASRPALIDNKDDTLNLVAQENGKICYATKFKGGSRYFTALIQRNHFPTGIVQFTLFSSKGEPLNERLAFILNPDQLNLNVSSEQQTYTVRQKVKIKLNAQDADNKPAIASFSVSVIDEGKVPTNENDENSILADLLLTSDLRGYIEKPNYYFNNPNEKTQADLDLLMLTQGYHRFKWKELLSGTVPALTFEAEKTLDVTGHITTLNNKPIKQAKVTLLSMPNAEFFLNTGTDGEGKFVFNNLIFTDSPKFVIQAKTHGGSGNVKINLDNILQPAVNRDKNAPDMQLNVNNTLATYLQSSKNLYAQKIKYGMAHGIELKEVEVNAKKPLIKHSSNLNGPGVADQVLMGDQLAPGLSSILALLTGRLTGIIVEKGHFYSKSGQMTVIVDDVVIPDNEFLSINPYDIESIEVLKTISNFVVYGGRAGPGGVIVVTLKNQDDFNKNFLNSPTPGMRIFSPTGYYKAREFYSPRYDDPKTNQAIADQRSTIYWNPNIVTDKDGNAFFDYFNAGAKGSYRIIVEGMTVDGSMGRKVYRYKVNE